MKRRKLLLGLGSVAAGGSALLGTGAFSRVESQRNVTIQVAEDPNAYLGLKPMDTPNSNNYVELDGNGHLTIDVGEHDDFSSDGPAEPGQGVNSDSRTWFDGMFQICNQGKEDACVSYTAPDDFGRDDAELIFYYDGDTDGDPTTSGRVDIEEGEPLPIPLGECVTIGLRTETFGVDATDEAPLFDGEATIVADVDGNCFDAQPTPDPACPDCTTPDPGTNDFDVTIESIDATGFPTIETTVRADTDAAGNGDLTASNFGVCEETVDGLGSGFCGQTIDDVAFAGADEEEEADVMLVMDTSGSMGDPVGDGSGDTKLDRAKEGAKTLLSDVGPGVNVGLVEFSGTDASEVAALGSATDTDIDGLSSGGGTPMDAGIDEGQSSLDADADGSTPNFMVVLANGNESIGSDARNAATSAKNAGTTVISIAYGDDANEELMLDISSPPKNGDDPSVIQEDDENAFVAATDDISDVFGDIAEIISGTYTIEYETANFATDGNDRNVRVYVDDPSAGDADATDSYTAPSS